MTTHGQVPAAARCQRCAYRWTPRKKSPVECPRCKSRSWMVPVVRGGGK